MKTKLLIALCCMFILTGCSVGNDVNTQQTYKRLWHLINVTGGIGGVNENFEPNTIVWSFNETTAKLTVTNDNPDDTIEDGLDSGTYDYSIINANGESYLVINDNELGELSFSQTGMGINENVKSTGTGADGFLYLFQLEVQVVE